MLLLRQLNQKDVQAVKAYRLHVSGDMACPILSDGVVLMCVQVKARLYRFNYVSPLLEPTRFISARIVTGPSNP